MRLAGVLLLIVISAALGVVPAFLLQRALEAIAVNDTTALSYAAAGMIAIVTGVLGVIQTLLSPAPLSERGNSRSAGGLHLSGAWPTLHDSS